MKNLKDTILNLTELEIKLMKEILDDYIIEEQHSEYIVGKGAKHITKKEKGVLGSLVKKGMLWILDVEYNQGFENQVKAKAYYPSKEYLNEINK